MVLERFWRGFGEDVGRFGEVLKRFSRKGLEEAPSPGRGPEASKRPREAPRPRKGWEEAQKAQKRSR